MEKLLIIFKHLFTVGSFLALIPIFTAIYFFRDRLSAVTAPLMIKLFFLFLGFIAVVLVIKIIKKFIHAEEDESQIDTNNLLQLSIFSAIGTKNILRGLGIVGVLVFIGFIPSPWNIFLILIGFYILFSYVSQIA